MSTKLNPGPYYAKLEPDEPYFLLMGRDPMASTLVEAWAKGAEMRLSSHREHVGDDKVPADYVTSRQAKIAEARACAEAMAAYCRAQGKIPMRWTATAPVITRVGLPRDVLHRLIHTAMNYAREGNVEYPETGDKIISQVPGVVVSE
jgi:hypothetical protein